MLVMASVFLPAAPPTLLTEFAFSHQLEGRQFLPRDAAPPHRQFCVGSLTRINLTSLVCSHVSCACFRSWGASHNLTEEEKAGPRSSGMVAPFCAHPQTPLSSQVSRD